MKYNNSYDIFFNFLLIVTLTEISLLFLFYFLNIINPFVMSQFYLIIFTYNIIGAYSIDKYYKVKKIKAYWKEKARQNEEEFYTRYPNLRPDHW